MHHSRVETATMRLDQVIESSKDAKVQTKLQKLKAYLQNNKEMVVDYATRMKQGLVFTSHLAESTVESLINQRCKGQQHMRWTREGVHPLLQVRSCIASNDWPIVWQRLILGAMTKSI
jgi:hypothetical protein